jgi:hypothetical protein
MCCAFQFKVEKKAHAITAGASIEARSAPTLLTVQISSAAGVPSAKEAKERSDSRELLKWKAMPTKRRVSESSPLLRPLTPVP